MIAWLSLQLSLLRCAVQFLTRAPLPPPEDFQEEWVTRAARYFPLVGQAIGGVTALILLPASLLWQGWIPAALAVFGGVLITGAFHEDGLADTADGLGGGTTAQRRLEIMKDGRIGTYGAIALVSALVLKVAALASMPAQQAAWSLLAAHGGGRAAAVFAMTLTPYAPLGMAGKWKPTPRGVRGGEAAFALLICLWPLAFLTPTSVAGGLVLGCGLALAVCVLARRLVGGHTGDILGAIEQVFEVGFLLGLAAKLP